MKYIRAIFLTAIAFLILKAPSQAQAAVFYEGSPECCPDFVFSLDFTLGYGRIRSGNEGLISSSLLDPILTQVLNTHNSTGGFSWRVFGNGLVGLNSWASIGGELGFTYYPSTKQIQVFALNVDDTSIRIERNILSKGYGVDLLLDLAFHPCSLFVLSVKPGVQFAYQSNRATLNIDVATAPFFFDTNARYKNTAFLPEIIISLDGSAWVNKFCSCKSLTMIGVTYQHVFGHNDNFVDKRVASRDMVGLNIGFVF